LRLESASLEHVTKLSSLQHLDLSHNQSTSTGFSLLSRLSSLVSLNLGCLPDFSDADFATLPPSIEELNLDSTGTTDEGLVHLRHLSKLRLLCLDRCRVTSAAVRALEAAVPSLVAPLFFSTLNPNTLH
jgi:Leucine-rich repeat (LRR) protein